MPEVCFPCEFGDPLSKRIIENEGKVSKVPNSLFRFCSLISCFFCVFFCRQEIMPTRLNVSFDCAVTESFHIKLEKLTRKTDSLGGGDSSACSMMQCKK